MYCNKVHIDLWCRLVRCTDNCCCPTCRAPSCFELSWPWRLEAGFFLKPKKDVDTDDDDVRKYLLSFRSLKRKYLWQCFFKCLWLDLLRFLQRLLYPMSWRYVKLPEVLLFHGVQVPEQSFTAGRQRERKLGKTHFVEHRTFLHVYHSFHRLWIFLVCMLQVSWK